MMAVEAGLGQMDINLINRFGERLKDVRKHFVLPSAIPFKRKLRYKMLEHSEKVVLKQAVDSLRWLRRKKYQWKS